MDLRWPLLSLALVAVLPALFWLLGWFRLPEDEKPSGLPIGAAERLRALPRFAELARQQVTMAMLQMACVGVLLVGAVWAAGRPMSTSMDDRPGVPGDLVICLDLTPGNRETDIEVLARANQVLDEPGLGDGRIALHGFQDTTAELVPITDDAGAARDRFTETIEALQKLGGGSGPSGAVGDGLATCAQAFDQPLSERGRAVLLVTANAPGTDALLTLAEGARYAEKHEVAVYPVAAGASAAGRADLDSAAEATGGQVVPAGALDRVLELERQRLDPPSVPVHRDSPLLPTVLVLLGAGGLVALGVRGMFR